MQTSSYLNNYKQTNLG